MWPDGGGSFHLHGASHFNVAELVSRMDSFDWTEGIVFKQARVGAEECPSTDQLGTCYPELSSLHDVGSTESFGRNWTHPSSPLWHPYEYFTASELGANPSGVTSASKPSLKTYSTGGFVAVIIPFFSETFLPSEQGSSSEVTDFRRYSVNTTNGRAAKYYCVRLSSNGRHIKQLCDPGAVGVGGGEASSGDVPTGTPMTGAVRTAVEEMWNDLKRGHWIDHRTRVVTLTLQLKNNHAGVRSGWPND